MLKLPACSERERSAFRGFFCHKASFLSPQELLKQKKKVFQHSSGYCVKQSEFGSDCKLVVQNERKGKVSNEKLRSERIKNHAHAHGFIDNAL